MLKGARELYKPLCFIQFVHFIDVGKSEMNGKTKARCFWLSYISPEEGEGVGGAFSVKNKVKNWDIAGKTLRKCLSTECSNNRIFNSD